MAVEIKGITTLLEERAEDEDSLLDKADPIVIDNLYSHITASFDKSKRARETSGITEEMLEGLRSFNGEYSEAQRAAIGSGSTIFMQLTSTMSRAASSWMQDILVGTDAYELGPTPVPEMPLDIQNMINSLVEEEFQTAKSAREEAEAAKQQEGQEQPAGPQKSKVESIREINEFKRDMKEVILNELNRESNEAFEPMRQAVKDSFVEGEWDKALLEFIDDFCIYPTAIMKGPVVTTDKKLNWEGGKAVYTDKYTFKNQRVNPLDCYPAPSANCPNDGAYFIEHLRLDEAQVSALRREGYEIEAIDEVLEAGPTALNTSNIETDLALAESKGNASDMNDGKYHGLHYHGKIKKSLMKDWGVEVKPEEMNDIVEVEVITMGSKVIKARLNKDQLNRRPYFSASFQSRPGSFWGNSLPYLIRDIQKMCNGAARSLADNMALSSGPQVEVYTDRMASDGPIDEIYVRKVWEVTSDPMGNSGRAINFFNIPSNAKELLGVYDRFEQMANDVIMIPKIAYSNEATKGAHQSFSGLAMLLEGASKGVKGCIRRIDYGLIIPRVKFEFHHIMLKGDLDYSGDIQVHALGSGALTMRASEELKRQEFLRIITAPAVMETIGKEGIVALVKQIGSELGLDENIVPTRFELKERDRINQANQEAQRQAELERAIAPTKYQVDGQVKMHEGTQATKQAGQAQDAQISQAELDLKKQAETLRTQTNIERDKVSLRKTEAVEANKANMQSKEIALSLQGQGTDSRDKMN